METMRARREFWTEHVQAWRDSGLTQVAYCQQHELKPKALAYWIRRSKQTATPLTLVPLAVRELSVAVALLLQHASGWQLALPAGVDAAWLACCGGWPDADAGTGLAGGRAGRYEPGQ